jgi:putative PIN family toxin of toxin-antitoxin system
MHRVVLDTNVIVAGLRSRLGASHRILQLLGTGRFDVVLSVPLVLEYEDVLMRQLDDLVYSQDELMEIVDFICASGTPQQIYYLWRPFLSVPKDDHVLEVAVAGRCETIVTHNIRDFHGVDAFGITALTPGEFLRRIGEGK